eukprot:3227032-Alexandrium_andersonii.AAC.1
MVLSAPGLVHTPPPLKGVRGSWARIWLNVAVSREITEPSPDPVRQCGPAGAPWGVLRVLGPTLCAIPAVAHAN